MQFGTTSPPPTAPNNVANVYSPVPTNTKMGVVPPRRPPEKIETMLAFLRKIAGLVVQILIVVSRSYSNNVCICVLAIASPCGFLNLYRLLRVVQET